MENTVIEAPKWLKDRMESLKKMPPPSLEEVKIQMEASKKFRDNEALPLLN